VIDESHELLPGTVYGATKVGAELLCRSYWRSYGVPFTVMRPTATANPAELIRSDSVFGRRWFVSAGIEWLSTRRAPSADQTEMLSVLQAIPDSDDKLYALVAEDGTSSAATYADARDAATGMRAMLEPEAPVGEAFNIGPAAPHDERALVEHIGNRLDMEVVEIRHRSVRPSWRVSTERAQAVLGYRPQRTVFSMVDEATSELQVAGGSR
jgi:nucleoside-diphosphate-sugar epimerase